MTSRPAQNHWTTAGRSTCSCASTRAASVASSSSSQHGHRRLRDDRAAVDVRRDEMHGAAVDAHAVGQRAPMRVQPGIRRQQRRMDVEHAAGVAPNEARHRARA